ncbi:exonuclease [Escherichia phage HH3]
MAIKPKRKTQSGSNTEHSLLGPSGAKKWMGCPAALVVEKDIPNESGQAAINGTSMHTVSEVVLNRIIAGEKLITAKTYKGCYVENEGKGPVKAHPKAPKGGVLVNDDMVKQCDAYIDHWRPLLEVAEFVQLEMRADLTRVLHPGVEIDGNKVKTFGTADMVMVTKKTDGTYMLIVGDLKTGRHKVEAKENKQLMLYALGLLRKLQTMYDITTVRLVIFQPYCGGASEWDISVEALEIFATFASKRAIAALDAYARGKKGLTRADFRPSVDACQWCRFADQCSIRAKAAIDTMTPPTATDEDLGDDVSVATEEECANHDRNMAREARKAARRAKRGKKESTPGAMSAAELRKAYEGLDAMRQHIKAIESAVFKAVMAGDGESLGLKMVAGKEGIRKWADESEVIEIFTKARIKRDVMYKETLLSPTDAEKVLKDEKPKVWAKLCAKITRAPAKPVLAPIDDPRPAWSEATDEDLSNE